jgi:hypothetical protein
MTLNPYQGLKLRILLALSQIVPSDNDTESLSGIETNWPTLGMENHQCDNDTESLSGIETGELGFPRFY